MPIDPSTVIRRFRDADARAVQECMVDEQDAIRRLDPRVLPGSAMVDAYFAQTMEACREHDGAIFVAAVDEQVVGFVTLLKRVPPSGVDDVPGTHALVMDLAVRAGWEGRGVGTALLQQAEAEARASGTTEVRLSVLSNNQRATDLYRRLGFLPYVVTMAKRFDASV